MKKLALYILLITGALLLIGSKATGQNDRLAKHSDRSWIDSLAVQYRVDHIESAMLKDQVALDSYYKTVSMLILNERNSRWLEKHSNEDLDLAIRDYAHEGLAQKLRRRTFEKEIRSARVEFGFAADQ